MLAEEEARAGGVRRVGLHDAERRVARARGHFDRPRELDLGIHGHARGREAGVRAMRIVGRERDPAEPLAAREELAPVAHRRVQLRRRQQLEVVRAEHDAVVLRAERVVAARREREAHARVGVARAVEVVDEEDDVVEAGDVRAHQGWLARSRVFRKRSAFW